MNMFYEEKDILGETQSEKLNQAFDDFLAQARGIRKQLVKQSYLLDKYLSYLFESSMQKFTYDAASNGFSKSGELMNICAEIVMEKPEHSGHWFFKQAKAYMDAHPLDFQEPYTKICIYFVLLSSDFMEQTAEKYLKELKSMTKTVLDICDLRELYDTICGILGNEEPMEKLNTLFRERFMIADTMSVFLQGMNNQVLHCLAYRDRETSQQVFRLIG